MVQLRDKLSPGHKKGLLEKQHRRQCFGVRKFKTAKFRMAHALWIQLCKKKKKKEKKIYASGIQ